MHGPIADIALGWCWLPIALFVRALEADTSHVHAAMGTIFLLSFAHQPLTLGLVYGDPAQMRAHRRLCTWAPIVAAAMIVIGLSVSLSVVALVAGLWNAEHTLMQRYGVLRIYGRKAGDEHGSIEKPMLIAWLIAGMAFLAAYVDLDEMVARLGLDETNARSARLLADLRLPAIVVFWAAVAAGVSYAVRWVHAERARGADVSVPKVLYAVGTLGLVVMVMLDPIAGIAGYVAAHAIEYFAVVHSSLRSRASTGDPSPVARATASRLRRASVYALYIGGTAALVWTTVSWLGHRAYAFAILFFGALHILYDGFVWKLRRPALAASLGITPAAP